MLTKETSELVRDAKSITSSLLNSRHTLHTSVMQADEAILVLQNDGQLISDTLDQHRGELRSGLEKTKNQLKQINRAESNQKRNLFLSLIFFGLVVCYIILKRTRILSIVVFSVNTLIWGKNYLIKSTSQSILPPPIQNKCIDLNFCEKEITDLRQSFEEKNKMIEEL